MSPETRAILQLYRDGNFSNRDLAEWLVQMEYADDLPQDERDSLARLRLVVIEEAEGRRNAEEVVSAVADLLARETPDEAIIVLRSGSATQWQPASAVTGVVSPARYAGI